MSVVRVRPDDWERFRAVRLASLSDSPAAFGSHYEDWLNAPEERWRSRLIEVPLTFVASDGSEDVGVVSGQAEGGVWAEMISMWVHPSARGTGVADDLIAAVVGWAAGQGRSTYLMVRSDNGRARAVYERAGFVDRGVPERWTIGEPPEHRMELRL